MKKILVLNGPNINLTGTREPAHYGALTLPQINEKLAERAAQLGLSADFAQTNHEGEIIDILHAAPGQYDGIILNAGAYTHTSLAIADAISAIKVPVIEVHISNVHAREQVRHHSMISAVCRGVIAGFGMNSYNLAINAFINY